MTDRDLDRELAELVNVAPPPAFAAKVRRRIGERPSRARWIPISWRWPISGSVALALLLIAAMAMRILPDRSSRTAGTSVSPERLVSRAAGATSTRALAPPPSLSLLGPPPDTRPTRRTAPRALVPASERAAMTRVIGAIADDQLPAPLAVMPPEAPIELAPVDSAPIAVAEIDVARIEVAPIVDAVQ